MQTVISPMPSEFAAKASSSKNASPGEAQGEMKQGVAAEFSQVMQALAPARANAHDSERPGGEALARRDDSPDGDGPMHADNEIGERDKQPAPEATEGGESGISMMMVGRGVAVAQWEVSYGAGDSNAERHAQDEGRLVLRLALGEKNYTPADAAGSDGAPVDRRAAAPKDGNDIPVTAEPLADHDPQSAIATGMPATPVVARAEEPDAGAPGIEKSTPAPANAAAVSAAAGEGSTVGDDPADRRGNERQLARHRPQLPEQASERASEQVNKPVDDRAVEGGAKRTGDLDSPSASDRSPARIRSQGARGNAEMASVPPLPAKAEPRIELVSLQTHLQPGSVNQPMAQSLGNAIADGLQEVLAAPVSAELPDETGAKGVSRHMEIELHPRELGVVRVVMVSRGGEIFIEIVPTTDKAHELLSAQRDILAQAIRHAGSPQAEISIRLSNDTAMGRDFQAGQNPNWGSNQGGNADAWSDGGRHRTSPEYRDDRGRQAASGQSESAESRPARTGLYL